VMILNKFGYDVTAVPEKQKMRVLRSLGAKNIINKTDLDKDARPIRQRFVGRCC